ncbi:ankyrin repeat and MYND domain-containing protein 2-like [Schistocerca nitens]|uniref:ankyrin repeat and MYND domain-containing protein 2-like n=1 Tax=Schistocerca nitens TaxID=7011 RepID=UPI0021174132|nr:ankyrin repeat and MYND domain-containing protein 2-like [Schistocerca nitens]
MASECGGTSEAEKEVFEKIANNDADGLKSLLLQYKMKPDVFDENGMTPLQHAAYKGNKEMVQMLLDQGADVNSGKHEHGYTALHFAALSGNAELCRLLLMAGAKSHATNTVGRTASQMAAFVGNHACVAVINNFVPKADVDYYTVPQGLETEPKLTPVLAAPLHKFVMQVNVHPVRVALNLQKAPLLAENLEKVQKILELMSEREMKRGFEANEVMSFKFHYLSCVVAEIGRCRKRQLAAQQERKKDETKDSENIEEKRSDPVELFARKMLKCGRGDNGSPEFQESFLRECVREFPYRECTVFRQMVTSLAQQDSPSALSIISAAINGQRGFLDSGTHCCSTCGEERATKKCSKCKAVQYCDRECQRLHWFMHKKACTRLSQVSIKAKPSASPPTSELRGLQVK